MIHVYWVVPWSLEPEYQHDNLQDECHEAIQEGVEQEQNKKFLIFNSNAVVKPFTVMIHL